MLSKTLMQTLLSVTSNCLLHSYLNIYQLVFERTSRMIGLSS
jgi:hypothetical protein